MPQVFGAGQISLLALASLWIESGFLEDVDDHEAALHDAGFDQEGLPPNLDKSAFHPRGDVWGQHLTTDGTHHTWAIARVANPYVDPNARMTDIGGQSPRYLVELHKTPRNPQSTRVRGSVTPIWEGNDIRKFLNGERSGVGDRSMTWPQVQAAMRMGPRR